jgi:hypothetical protein
MSAPTFQDVIQTLNRYWAAQGCVLLQPLDTEVGAQAPSTPPPSCEPWVRSRGPPRMCSLRDVLPTAATAKTQIVCSITTSIRWS